MSDRYGLTGKEMRGMPREYSVKIAEKLLVGQLVVDSWIKESFSFSAETLNWDIAFSASPTTFQLFLQGLTPVAYLTGAYTLTNDLAAYSLAGCLIKSWFAFYADRPANPAADSYVYDQHAVALRAEALLYYLLIGTENGLLTDDDEQALVAQLKVLGAYLADPAYYLKNENHGVFEDRALIYLGYALRQEEWTTLAAGRLAGQWDYLFSPKGVCAENSFHYQLIDKDLFLEAAQMLRSRENVQGEAILRGVGLAEDFMGYTLLPNACCPPFGDSVVDDCSQAQVLDPAGVWAFSCGKSSAACPPRRAMIYQDEGYYVGREFWRGRFALQGMLRKQDSFYAFFRCGYKSITHRQADDNSFILYARGYDVFTDAGLYNYLFRDPMRQYVRSANAHNTVVVDGSSYDFLRRDLTAFCGMFHSAPRGEKAADYVVGFNKLRMGVMHIRHFFYFDTDVLIVDELFSGNRHEYGQLFHCGKAVDLMEKNKQEASLKIGDSGYTLHLRQLVPCDALQVFHGETSGTLYGNISEQFNETLPVYTLKFNTTASRATFVTALSLHNTRDASVSGCTFCVDMETRELEVTNRDGSRERYTLVNAGDYQLGPRYSLPMDDFSIHRQGNSVSITNMNTYGVPVEYAWYLVERNGKKAVRILAKTRYTAATTFTFETDDAGLAEGVTYAVQAFVYCKANRRKVCQTAAIISMAQGVVQVRPCMDYAENIDDWL